MFDLKKEWSISFAGCGFMGIYYVGATSCILERFPRFIQDASKIYGASAGSLMATVLSVGIPLGVSSVSFMTDAFYPLQGGKLAPAISQMLHHKPSAIEFHYIGEKADISTAGISKIQQLTPKQSRWMNSTTEECCADLMLMAKEARKHKLGPLHPAYNLLQMVKDSLVRSLPEDAHVRASGKLCVSLTRVSDGKNVLVSEFDSREELIQALVCSCFVPFYCGVIPPTYRGVHYVDGAVSDNLPRCHLKNTVTFSPYAGESDLCPRATTHIFHEVRFNNMSIQVNSENVYRVTRTFFPPEPEAMAEICQNGYIDALRFLQENNLISSESPLRSLETDAPKPAFCELVKEPNESTQQNGLKSPQEEHQWLDPQLIEHLPVNIKKALCEACRETHTAGGLLSHMTEYLPKKVTSYLQMPRILPVESAYSLAQRLVGWIPDVPRDMSWFYGLAGDRFKQALQGEVDDYDRETPLRRCTSLPDLNLCDLRKEDTNALPMTPEATPTSSLTFTWNTHTELDFRSLTPPPTPTFSPTSGFDEVAAESPQSAGRSWGLGRAVGWIRNIGTERTSNH